MYQKKSILVLISLLLIGEILIGQTFTATQDENDAWIDLDWSFDVDPCLLNNNGVPYDQNPGQGVVAKLFANGNEIESFPFADLSPFLGPDQPTFDYVSQMINPLGYYAYDFENDPVMQVASNYTLEFWIRSEDPSTFICNDIFPNSSITLINHHQILFVASGDEVGSVSFDTLRTDAWNHFAFATNGLGKTFVYINGTSVGTINYKFPLTDFKSFGGTAGTSFAQVRVWNVKRSDVQIASNYLVTSFAPNQSNLLIHLKHEDEASSLMTDFAMVDNNAQVFNIDTNFMQILPYESTPKYTPLTGNFRDLVGPDQTISYELKLLYPPLLFPESECGIQQTIGSTLPYQEPTKIKISNNHIEKITLAWQNNSTLTSSFKVKRDGSEVYNLSNGIEVGDTFLIEDIFEFDNGFSIQNGENYPYTIEAFSAQSNTTYLLNAGVGSTIPMAFNATDVVDGFLNKINLSWSDTISTYIDKYELRRNGDFVLFFNKEEFNYTDFLPIYGNDNSFELIAWRDNQPFISDKDIGTVPPNGKIKGRVVTQKGNYPVAGATVNANAQIGTSTGSSVTNALGEFEIVDLTYGLIDSFILSAALTGHTFVQLADSFVTLTRNKPTQKDIVILDLKEYENDNTNVQILSFQGQPEETQDRVSLDWLAISNIPEVFVELTRDGELVYTGQGLSSLDHQLVDLEGQPGTSVVYTFRVFTLKNEKVKEVFSNLEVTFPEVAIVSAANFSATPNTALGIIDLSWTHSSTNIKEFAVYRNGDLIATVPQNTVTYQDSTFKFNTNLTYKIGAVRDLDGISFEAKPLTIASPNPVNIGSFPVPMNLVATEQPNVPSVKIKWDQPASIGVGYNYTGYRIYRDNDLISVVYKDRILEIEDRAGFSFSGSINYYVSAFRLNKDGSVEESDKVATNSVIYPALPVPQDMLVELEMIDGPDPISRIVQINLLTQFSTETTNFDGYRLYRDGLLVVESAFPFFRDAPPAEGTVTYELKTIRKLNGQTFESLPASEDVLINFAGNPLLAPSNLTVSRDLPNHVKICWDYDDDLKSQFVISKLNPFLDPISSDTLPTTARSFYDYDVSPQEFISTFEISAINSGFESDRLLGIGKVVERKSVYGVAYQEATKSGIPNVLIQVFQIDNPPSINPIPVLQTKTDSSGFYYFESDQFLKASFLNTWIKASSPNSDFAIDSIPVVFGAGTIFCELNFSDSYQAPASPPDIYKINHFALKPDTMSLSVLVHWNANNENFSKVEVNRGLNKLAEAKQTQPFIYKDTSAVPGIGYRYSLRAVEVGENKRLISPYIFESVTVPTLEAVVNLTGTVLESENSIWLQWSHRYNNADKYLVLKNGEVVAEINRDAPFQYFDKNGNPGTTYRYDIVAVKETANGLFAADPKTISLQFPRLSKVPMLEGEVTELDSILLIEPDSFYSNYTLNHVELKWTYTDSAVHSFKIFRNDVLFEEVDGNKRSFKDYTFIPESNVNYSISVTKMVNGVLLESDETPVCQSPVCLTFPKLIPPSGINVHVRDSLGGIEITFDYLPKGADGFYIYRTQTNNDSTFVVLHDPELDSTSFSFVDFHGKGFFAVDYAIQTFSIRNASIFESDTVFLDYVDPFFLNLYPTLPAITNVQATKGELLNAVKLTWNYPEGIPFDSFRIIRNSDDNSIPTAFFTVESGLRNFTDFVDFVPNSSSGMFQYSIVIPFANGNGVDGDFSSFGFPRLDDNSLISIDWNGNQSSILHEDEDLVMNDDWMIFPEPGYDRITAYKFDGLQYLPHQTFSSGLGNDFRFGHAVDIDSNYLIVGMVNLSGSPDSSGAVYIYELLNEQWLLDTVLKKSDNQYFGYDVAIHGNRFVTSNPYENEFYVYEKVNGSWSEIPVIKQSNASGFAYLGWSVDIFGENVIVGTPHGDVIYQGISQPTGFAAAYKFDVDTVRLVQPLLYNFDYNDNAGFENIRMGWDVKMDGDYVVVSAIEAGYDQFYNPGSGAVTTFRRESNGSFTRLDNRIFSDSPGTYDAYGYRLALRDDVLIVSEPECESSELFAYKMINEEWIEIGPGRPDFNDPGFANDKYPTGFGKAIGVNDKHIGVFAPGYNLTNPYCNVFPDNGPSTFSRLYLFDLYPYHVSNVQASDSVGFYVELTWSNDLMNAENISNFAIYRNDEWIANVSKTDSLFIDRANNRIPESSSAIAGVIYNYTVKPVFNSGILSIQLGEGVSDQGNTLRNGKIAGNIYVEGTTNPVENVLVSANAMINGNFFSFSDFTDELGYFEMDNLPYEVDGTIYEVDPILEDHTFELINPIAILPLRSTSASLETIVFYDTKAFSILGHIARQDANCGLEDIKVVLCKTINGNTSRVDSVYTISGDYIFIVNPNEIGLEKLSVIVDDVQVFEGGNMTFDSIRFGFEPQTSTQFENFSNFASINTVDFIDTLTYSVFVQVQNTCGNAISNSPYVLRFYTINGCYDKKFTTSSTGILETDLPVHDYLIVVKDVNGATSDDLLALDYLSSRPSTLNIQTVHNEMGLIEPLPFNQVNITFHKAATFGSFNNIFDRYICDDSNKPAILIQGEDYTMPLQVFETFINTCHVNEGYIQIRNAASTSESFIQINLLNGTFEDYFFTAGQPNLIAPHLQEISFNYFSAAGDLLATASQVVVVEGEKSLPGSDVIVEPNQDEDGQIKLPMFLLRDPPGDQSYSKLETGGSFTKKYQFNRSSQNDAGIYTEGKVGFGAGLLVGGFYQLDARWGKSTSNTAELEFTLNNVESFSTSISEEAVGRDADVIVGAGFASQYGLTQRLTVADCDSISITNKVSFGLSDISTTWSYTVQFIEGIISEQIADSILIEKGLKSYYYADGTPYTQEDARAKVSALINSWRDIIHYHDVESVPFYALCASSAAYSGIKNPLSIFEISAWRGAFCGEIGTGISDDFIMNEDIEWNDGLITKYNNTIAAIEELKRTPFGLPIAPNAGFSQNRFEDSNYAIAQSYHNTLAFTTGQGVDNSKSAENITTSGLVLKERTVTTQQSGSVDYAYTAYSNIDLKAGLYSKFEGEITIPFINQTIKIAESEIKTGFAYSGSSSHTSTRTNADQTTSTMYYRLLDGDADDEISVLVMQGTMQNHSPYFLRLGGRSSCPAEEALSPGNDSDPVSIDNPFIGVVNPNSGAVIASGEEGANAYAPPQYNIADGDVAEFNLTIANNSSTTLTRDIEVFLPLQSNPNGAIITLNGAPFGLSPILIEDVPSTNGGGNALPFILRIERPNGSAYDFENIAIGVRPGCDGAEKFVFVSAHFQSPCSPITLSSPINGFVVNREKVNDFNDRELIRFEMRDYQSSNVNLDGIQLQYQRLGTGIGWENVPFGYITRSELVTNDAMLSLTELPIFFFEWDITGQYNIFPDGEYAIRAIAVCNAGGDKFSNKIFGEIRRTQILTGNVEPADGIWQIGDEISIAFSQNMDCGLITTPAFKDSNLILIDMSTNLEVPFNIVCQNNKLIYQPIGNMSQYDGHIFKARSKEVQSLAGNFAEDEVWSFKVVTQDVDWKEAGIEVYLYEGSVATYKAQLLNTSGTSVGGLSILQSASSEHWMQVLPQGMFDISTNDILITLNLTGSEPVGIYDDTLVVAGLTGRLPEIPVRLHILAAPPSIEVSSTFGDSMLLIINWRFDDEIELSKDTMDQIQAFIGNEVRGLGKVQKAGPFYQVVMKVSGEAADDGTPLDFEVWNSDESSLYEGLHIPSNIEFQSDAVLGTTHSPEVLIVESAPIIRKRIYVDSAQVNNPHLGITWSTAYHKLEDALSSAMPFDTIWVAEGSYFPTPGTDRSATFDISTNLIIYGGFISGQSSINQRTGNSITKISGDIGAIGDASDNSYSVIKSSSDYLILDGLFVEAGNANSTGANSSGGSITNSGFITLRNCRLQAFESTEDGSIILNTGSNSKMILQDVQILSEGLKARIKNELGARLTVVGSLE